MGGHRASLYKRRMWLSIAPKRGNEPYARRVKERFDEVLENMEDIVFFDERNKHSLPKTRALFVTLTYDPKRLDSVDESWIAVSADWNRFITALRKKYGKIQTIRCYEAQGNGNAHVHALLLFEENDFSLTYLHGKWRLVNYQTKERLIGKYWSRGYVDVLGLPAVKKAVSYIGKYLTKCTKLDEDDDYRSKRTKTNALMWIYRKRSFSLSGGLQRYMRRLDLIRPCITQTDFSGEGVLLRSVECLGTVVASRKPGYEGKKGPPPPLPYKIEVLPDDFRRVLSRAKLRPEYPSIDSAMKIRITPARTPSPWKCV